MSDSDTVPQFAWLNKDFLTKVVQNQFSCKTNEFVIDSFEISLVCQKGENYLGTLLRVKVNIIINSQKIEQFYVVKTADGDGNTSSNISNQYGVYPKEEIVYKNIIPEFENIWKEVGVEVTFAPKCYFVTKDPVEAIVFEDLKQSGFLMGDRISGLDLDHISLVIEKLAKFHAASLIYLKKYEKFDEKFSLSYYDEKMYCGELKQLYTKLYISFKEAVESWSGFEKISQLVDTWEEDVFLHGVKAAKEDSNTFTVLVHGDLWVNNILFNYTIDGKPSDLRFIDFQITSIKSPIIDLNTLITTSMRADERTEYFDNVILLYQESLEKNLKILNYTSHIPTIHEMQDEMLKRSMLCACSILDCAYTMHKSDDSSNVWQNCFNEDQKENIRKLFTNNVYVYAIQKYLKFLYKRGMLNLP